MFDIRLVAYAANGTRLGQLPYPLTAETGAPLNDVPWLRVGYSAEAAGIEWLDTPCEIAVEWSAGGDWAEAANARFLRIKRRGDQTDKTGARSYDLPGWAWQLKKMVLYPGDALVEGKRQFSAATVGAILLTHINEGQERGTLPGLDVDFTTTHDSSGNAWTAALTLGLDPGTDLLATLLNLSQQGVVDWQMQGRTLRCFNGDTTLNRDLATGPAPVELRFGRDVTEAPDDGTFENASNVILIAGEAGLNVEVTSPNPLPWGRWETYQSQSGVSDPGTAALLGQNLLQRASGERVQITRGITLATAEWLPYRDYQPGDTISAPGDGGTMQALRIRDLTLSRDANGVTGGNVTLNDRFLERDIQLARRAAGILDGGVATGGTGGTPAVDAIGRTPAAPTGLIVEPDAYLDTNGWARGQITATWSPVSQDVNGVAIDIDTYEIWGRRNVSGQEWAQLTAVVAPDTTATYSPLDVNVEYSFKVRGTSQGKPGEFSAEYVTTIPGDVTPPPVPSTPALSTRMSIIYVGWDGMAAGGGAMPIDFDRVRVWMSDDGVTYEDIGSLRAAGAVLVTGQSYGEDRTFRLTALDRSGNESAAGSTATIATAPLVDTDVIGQVIDGANIVDGSITASDKVVAHSITGTEIQALAISAGHIQANAIEADHIAAGAVEAGAIAADAIDGKTITGAFIRTAASGERLELAPPGAVYPELRFYPGSGSNYSVLQTRDDVASGEATLLITSSQDAAAQYRAQLQMSAKSTVINVMDQDAAAPKGGRIEIADTHGRFGYSAGDASTETFLHNDSSGRYYIRGRFMDETVIDAYDSLSVGTTTIGGSGGSINYMWLLYPVTMASLMGVVCTVRDGGSGNFQDNTYTPKAWSVTWNSASGFQVNLAAANSFELSWWNNRH
ncbi:fibronectin type III domain-containing protein [Microbispora sp. RL4-1S]|uniref:Fibronectin type III domain-containing protein n=1 Tax=Microbispora oryzae TaxID=2806554 RepID=A0A940WNR8_9ACTN|nr:fibronectin type III domain-containing protein [Microbispora oryzae]MBP2704391.1 fibronectin type III domain-containing protein [Microbispora oryzae]